MTGKEAEGEDGSVTLQVVAKKAVKVSSSFEDDDKAGTLLPKALVKMIEERTADDGAKRAFVSSVAADVEVVTTSLNEFNHSVQRFASAAEYESNRLSYCENTCEREAMVEDAITGNPYLLLPSHCLPSY